jgi:hypothetical protein
MSGLMQRILRRRGRARLSPNAPPGADRAPADGHQAQPPTMEAPARPTGTGADVRAATAEAATPDARAPAATTAPPTAATATTHGEAPTTVAPAVAVAPPPAEQQGHPAEAGAPAPAGVPAEGPAERRPSFRERARLRRRLRFLRRLRELGFRDLGGLVFDQHRFGRPDDELVRAKLTALAAVDAELRALERVLADRRPVAELREPGISACAHCGAVIGSDARFCSSCGTRVGGAQAPPGVIGQSS